MADKDRSWGDIALDGHEADVLREIVRRHIQTGEPISSASRGTRGRGLGHLEAAIP